MSDIKCNTNLESLFNRLLISYKSFRERDAERFSNDFGYNAGRVFEREMNSIKKDSDNYSDEWNRLIKEHDAEVRADAIDEFVQKYKSETEECDIGYDCNYCCYHSCIEGITYDTLEEIAQQLKEKK